MSSCPPLACSSSAISGRSASHLFTCAVSVSAVAVSAATSCSGGGLLWPSGGRNSSRPSDMRASGERQHSLIVEQLQRQRAARVELAFELLREFQRAAAARVEVGALGAAHVAAEHDDVSESAFAVGHVSGLA